MLYAFGFLGCYNRRFDRTFLGGCGAGCSCPRHLFCRSPFPLHQVGGTVMAYMGGIALLVAENLRSPLSRRMGQILRPGRICWI